MPLLSDEDVERRLGELDGWELEGKAIHKRFKLEDFEGAIEFVNRLTPVAEGMNHHPDLAISWDTVDVTITTHSEGGLTENDFELATKIDSLG